MLVFVAFIVAQAQAVYFYAQKGKTRCFSDTVVSNNTLEMEVQVLDKEVLNMLVHAND